MSSNYWNKPGHLAGDVRTLDAGQTAQLIDMEYATPRVLLVTAQASGGVLADWTIRSGVYRSQLAEESVGTDKFSRVVVARSVKLTVVNNSILNDIVVKAVVVEIDASMAVGDILGTDPVPAVGAPNESLQQVIPVNVASVNFAGLPGIFAEGKYLGFTVHNYSPAGSNLYLLLGAGPAAIATGMFTQKIAPGGYYEFPFGYNGEVRGIWDLADAAGFAACTVMGFNSSL